MKRSREKCLCAVLVIMLAGGLLLGCGDEKEEVMADSVAEDGLADTMGTEDTDTSKSDGISGDDLDASGESVSQNSVGGDGQSIDEGNMNPGESGISGNSLEAGNPDKSTMDNLRREPVKVKGIYVSGPVAGAARMDELIELVDQTELNAIVVDIKNDEGKVTYDMQSDQVKEIEASVGYIPDIEALVTKCREKNIYLIARIVAFRDPYLAEKKPEWTVHTKDGGIFRDKSGLAWVNPYEREVWDYLIEIASQAAAVGFDEVQFDYIRFSTDIKADAVDYGPESENVGKIEIITEFTEYIYESLAPLGVYVAADVFGTVIENEIDQQIVGQDYVKMAEHLDYICPMIYPSHYRNGSYGINIPDADPYRTIYGACSASVKELDALPEGSRAGVRAWLQGFTASWVPGHISYGPQQIRAQIKGAYDAGYDEWILWNAAVKYQRDSLLTDEEAEAERQRWETERQEAAEKRVEPTGEVQPESAEQQSEPSAGAATEQEAGSGIPETPDAGASGVPETQPQSEPPVQDGLNQNQPSDGAESGQ